jgi:uncharacterized protein YdeI (YjbR/CyaY-like superfamily)
VEVTHEMITKAEDFFSKGCGRCKRFATPDCSTRLWQKDLQDLRRICLSAGLGETAKWGHPCYMYAGRNIAMISAFRGDCRITFFNAALLQDPDGILEKPGPNSSHPSLIRISTLQKVIEMQDVILSYLQEAKCYAEAGIDPPKHVSEIILPEELVDALDADPELAEAFHNLTPGRQRSYVINLNSAKAPATRVTRIAKLRERILAGKGANEI